MVVADRSALDDFDAGRLVDELELLVNDHRRSCGLRELRRHPILAAAARQHSSRMRNLDFFDHCDPYDRTSAQHRVQAVDRSPWRIVAENLAARAFTARQIVDGWIESPGHRANLEHPQLSHVGTSVALGGSMHTYATQVYGASWTSLADAPSLTALRDRIVDDAERAMRRFSRR